MNLTPIVAFLLGTLVVVVNGHGRLLDPPSRASMWRFGFGNPADYNDNEGFCGGFNHQFLVNGGKCGICGDPWDAEIRQHEVGGKFANGIIVAEYKSGQVIEALIQITANHRGYFQFRLCPNNNINKDPDQQCFDNHLLQLADGSGTRYHLQKFTPANFLVELKLPEGLNCEQCILQWTYTAGNNWGVCKDGTGRVGCGNQEHFRACADISIVDKTEETTNDSVSTTRRPLRSTTKITIKTSKATPPVASEVTTMKASPTAIQKLTTSVLKPSSPATSLKTVPAVTSKTTAATPKSSEDPGTSSCVGVGVMARIDRAGEWCKEICFHDPPFCPPSHCKCS